MIRAHDRPRPAAALGLATALLLHAGCTDSKPPSLSPGTAQGPATASGAAGKAQAAPTAATKGALRPPFTGWTAPAAAIVITGEQFGYLEPCGCTAGQTGGLMRRYNLVEQLRTGKKWPVAAVDLGSLVKDPASARGGPEQSKLKFTTSLRALALMKYDALALSPEDLEVGVDEAIGQFLNLPGDRLKVVAANVTAPGLEAKVVPSVRVTAGSVKIGVTAVVDPAALKALKDPSLDLLQVKPIESTLPGVLAELEKSSDVQILLVQGPPDAAKALAAQYPSFDIVVGTSSLADPDSEPERLNGGKTLLVNVGHKGKYVGVVGVYPGGAAAYRYEKVSLDQRFDEPANPMKAVIEDEFRETLKQQKTVEGFPKHRFVASAGDTAGATFVGVDACKKCHPNTVDAWAESKHSHAFASLEHDPKPNTIFDVECISCHTVGFDYTSGYRSAESTPLLRNVQCENCHGPASKHVAEPTVKAHLQHMRVTKAQAERNRLCYQCHDDDNSPHFDFEKYWADVEHNGLDNPREHLDPGDRAKFKSSPAAAPAAEKTSEGAPAPPGKRRERIPNDGDRGRDRDPEHADRADRLASRPAA